jgi:hypothetical protein
MTLVVPAPPSSNHSQDDHLPEPLANGRAEISALRALLISLKVMEPASIGNSRKSYSFIGLSSLSERIENNTGALYSQLENLFDASHVASKSSRKYGARKERTAEQQVADKKEAVYQWAATECCQFIRDQNRLSAKLKMLHMPRAPQHRPLKQAVAELRKTRAKLNSFIVDWDYKKPEDSLHKFAQLRIELWDRAQRLVKICHPSTLNHENAAVPTSAEIKRALTLVKRSAKTLEDISDQLPITFDLSVQSRQNEKVALWRSKLDAAVEKCPHTRGRLERWGISSKDLDGIVDGLRHTVLPPIELRHRISTKLDTLCASKVAKHFSRRLLKPPLPSGLPAWQETDVESHFKLPETWDSWSIAEKEGYLKAEHGWRYSAYSKALTNAAQKEGWINTIPVEEKLLFIHHLAVRYTTIDGIDLFSVFATTTPENKPQDPWIVHLQAAWGTTVRELSHKIFIPSFAEQLSALISLESRDAGRDEIPHRYEHTGTLDDVTRKYNQGTFVLKEFRSLSALVNQAFPDFSNPDLALLEAQMKNECQLSVRMVGTMLKLSSSPPAPSSSVAGEKPIEEPDSVILVSTTDDSNSATNQAEEGFFSTRLVAQFRRFFSRFLGAELP